MDLSLCVDAGSAGPSVDVLYYKSGILSSLEVALRVLLDYRFSVPFLINQCGSIANNILLGAAPISLVSPITNALTFLFTALTASFLGEKINFTLKKAFGIVCILAGFALCLYGSDVS